MQRQVHVRSELTKEEPRASRSEKYFAMSPLAVMANKVAPACLGRRETLSGILQDSSAADLVGVTLGSAGGISFDVLDGLLGIAGHIEGITGSLGNGETEIESNAAWHSTKSDNDTPRLVNSKLADTIALTHRLGSQERVLEAQRRRSER